MLLADIKQLLIMVRPAADRDGATEIVLVASLNYARRLNLGVGGVFTGYRPLYRWGRGRGTRALEGLLRALDLRLRTGGLIPPAASPEDTI
jgi:hypothetical protein